MLTTGSFNLSFCSPQIPAFVPDQVQVIKTPSYSIYSSRIGRFNETDVDSSSNVCSLSHRVKVNPRTTGSAAFRHFISGYQPTMSADEERIKDLVSAVRRGRFTECISDPELPYLALAACAQDRLSVWQVSDLLLIYQLTVDYPEHEIEVFFLLDEEGNWTAKGKEYIVSFFVNYMVPMDRLESLRKEIQLLPRSQQIRYGIPNVATTTFLSLCAEHLLFSSVHGKTFDLDPRLGLFTKQDITRALVYARTRPCHIPFPGLPSPKIIHGDETTPTLVAAHDRFHNLILHHYSSHFVDAIRELLKAFARTTKQPGIYPFKDLFEISDMVLNRWVSTLACPNVNKEFDNRFRGPSEHGFLFEEFFGANRTHNLFGWNSILRINADRKRWREQYGLDPDEVPLLQPMDRLFQLAEPYLRGRKKLEKIYLLQELQAADVDTVQEIDRYFKAQPKTLPRLILEQAPEKSKLRGRIRLVAIDDSTTAFELTPCQSTQCTLERIRHFIFPRLIFVSIAFLLWRHFIR